MPLTGPGSFVSTLNDFIPHWDVTNVTLGAGGPLVIRNPNGIVPPTLNRADLIGLKTDLVAKHTDIEGEINNLEIASADLKTRKEAMHLRGGQFNEKVRGLLGNTAFAQALPDLPQPQEGEAIFVKPMNDDLTLWGKINLAVAIPGFTPPLLLLGGYPVADFTTDLGLLKAQFELVSKEELLVTLRIHERNAIQKLIIPVLRDYRKLMPTFFAADHPLVLSMPRLYPEPGSTPDAVGASGIWDAPTTQGKITWTASAEPTLAGFEVRWSPGSSYNTEDEVVIGNIAKDAPREFFTLQGLGLPGAVSVFKVYVMTTTGNEKGSNTVQITRP